ncbi:hypothetical protein X975_02873, partial [Stegodyphus mimosarum]
MRWKSISQRIPPVVITEKNPDWTSVDEMFQEICAAEFETKIKDRSIYLQTKSLDNYKNAMRNLQKAQINFHAYQFSSESSIKVILKNIPSTVTRAEIF